MIGNVPIQLTGKSNSPYYIRLDDRVGHLGTVASGLFANLVFIRPFNEKYGLNITPLSDKEILAAAGIVPVLKSPNYLGVALLCIALVSALVLASQAVTLPSSQIPPSQE
jgi:hypothetical protein